MSLLVHTTWRGNNGATSSALDTTGAKIIAINVSSQLGVSMTVTDSQGNTYTPLTTHATGSTAQRLWYCLNPTTSATHTFTMAGASSFSTSVVGAFSDAGTFDVEAGAVSSAATTKQPGSITPAATNALCLVGATNGTTAGVTATIDSSYSVVDTNPLGSGNYGSFMWYKLAVAGATNPTVTFSGSVECEVGIASFKASGAAAGFFTNPNLLNGLGAAGPLFQNPL